MLKHWNWTNPDNKGQEGAICSCKFGAGFGEQKSGKYIRGRIVKATAMVYCHRQGG